MITLVFRFPTGHYHATPWGQHVNEGAVEWPPSPWRILRALISVGHTALGWDDGIPATARALIGALASVSPSYILPPAGLGHTRHYMPQAVLDKGREKTALVFDAFATPGDGALSVTWPTELPPECRDLLGELARHLNHLGRAESLVEASLLAEGAPPSGDPCVPCDPNDSLRGPHWEQTSLLAPCSPADYDAWRAAAITPLRSRADLQPKPGKPLTAKQAKDMKAALAPYPEDLWACLCASTAVLQSQGWSQPPGSRRILYWRRADALEVAPRSLPRRRSAERVESVLLALGLPSGNRHALPPVRRALPQAELLHRSAISLLGRGRPVEWGEELVGRDAEGQPLRGHRHAHILPVDLDGDGHLDHVLFWAPGGFGPEAVQAIKSIRETWTKGGADTLRLALAAEGPLAVLSALPEPWAEGVRRLRGPSRRWISSSPFVPPRHLKPRGANALDGQVRAELESRGLPAPTSVALMDREVLLEARLRHHVRERTHGGTRPPSVDWFGLVLTFEAPIEGPICLGYGAHFGLGLFTAS